jgi:hypothetical protein
MYVVLFTIYSYDIYVNNFFSVNIVFIVRDHNIFQL